MPTITLSIILKSSDPDFQMGVKDFDDLQAVKFKPKTRIKNILIKRLKNEGFDVFDGVYSLTVTGNEASLKKFFLQQEDSAATFDVLPQEWNKVIFKIEKPKQVDFF